MRVFGVSVFLSVNMFEGSNDRLGFSFLFSPQQKWKTVNITTLKEDMKEDI